MRARAPQDRVTLAEPRAPVAERVAKAYTRCGLSITLTSATDVCAFLLGATSNLPAIHVFCMYAAAAIMLTFCFMCTGVALGAALCAKQRGKARACARWRATPMLSPMQIQRRRLSQLPEALFQS